MKRKSYNLTVNYLDQNGNTLKAPQQFRGLAGQHYPVGPMTINKNGKIYRLASLPKEAGAFIDHGTSDNGFQYNQPVSTNYIYKLI